jgi:dTDP-4-dehydrorhamnose reductase
MSGTAASQRPVALRGPIVSIGTTGQLGSSIARLLEGPGFAALGRDRIDLSRPETLRALDSLEFGVLLNCAAWTDVDGAEANEAGANAVNADAVGVMAEICRRRGATLVNYSTDYVFDGQGTSPYRTDQARAPLNAYGRSKARGEELLELSGCDYLLVRTSWVYAPIGKNFVRTIRAAARTRPSLKVVSDQRGRPTSADNLAEVTLRLLDARARGIYHVTDAGECSWFDFAKEIVRLAGLATPVDPCTSAEFPRPAKRPAYSVLDLSKTEALVGPMMEWKDALADVMGRMSD